MGVRPSLPMGGIQIILGNDLAGDRVWPGSPISQVEETLGMSKRTIPPFRLCTAKFYRMRSSEVQPVVIFSRTVCWNVPRSDAQLATYGDVQVMNMVTHFESVLSEEEVTNIPRQWPALKARLKYRQRQPPKEVISDLLTENHPDVMDVLVLVYIMVTLSPSSAAMECGFSLMNLIKTSRKSQMTNETLGSLMRVSHITTTVPEFDPEPAIQKWKTSA
nr:zinc finger protein 862-like isoform X2 [Pseudochaenichthys georgianus]